SARGTGEIQQNPTGSSIFLRSILSKVPNGDKHEVVYPADINYMGGPPIGAREANAFMSSHQGSCPGQLYVLFGYSEGAMVVTQTLNSLKIPPKLIVAVVMYGNPYKTSNAVQNKGLGRGGVGIAAATGVKMNPKFAPVVYDLCNAGDMICQTGGNMMAHLNYRGTPQEAEAVNFVVQKLKEALSGKGGGKVKGSDEGNDDEKGKGDGNYCYNYLHIFYD
ncbi:family 5 carbohydrate esterase, partial [Phakopsora pachyrhizi]